MNFNLILFILLEYKKKEDISNQDQNIVIDNEFLEKMPEYTILMHPLPRNNEIHPSCDKNNRSVYYEQMKNGVYIRMAIIYKLLIID